MAGLLGFASRSDPLRGVIGDVGLRSCGPAVVFGTGDLLRRLPTAELDQQRDSLIIERLDRFLNLGR